MTPARVLSIASCLALGLPACGGGPRGPAAASPRGEPGEIVVHARPASRGPGTLEVGAAEAEVARPPAPGPSPSPEVGAACDLDSDGDGIADCDDACPDEPEVWNGLEDEDGCPDMGRVLVESARIEVPPPLARPTGGPVAEPGIPDDDHDAVADSDDRGSFEDRDGMPEPGLGAPLARGRQQGPDAARLTAAVVADADDRAGFLEYLARHEAERLALGLEMGRRMRFRVVDSTGRPVHDSRLTLVGRAFRLEGRTHADGTWDLVPGLTGQQVSGPATLYVEPRSGAVLEAALDVPAQGDGRDVVVVLPGLEAAAPRALDLVFLVDVTGSMGDELAYVTEEVSGIVRRVVAALPDVEVRLGATLYRDRGDARPLEQVPMTDDVSAFAAALTWVRADGGGDYPEDMNAGLAAALATHEWSEGPAVRVLVLIADAPPQPYGDEQYTYRHAMADASRRGIRILPVAASGADRVVELLFRSMGVATSTPYVYLTDDSGVGLPHLEADSGPVAVEGFADCLTRLLVSDLRGLGMHAPAGP